MENLKQHLEIVGSLEDIPPYARKRYAHTKDGMRVYYRDLESNENCFHMWTCALELSSFHSFFTPSARQVYYVCTRMRRGEGKPVEGSKVCGRIENGESRLRLIDQEFEGRYIYSLKNEGFEILYSSIMLEEEYN